MKHGTALIAVSTLHRSLRLRRLAEPFATVTGCSDPAALPMLAVATGARLLIVDLDVLCAVSGLRGERLAAAEHLVGRIRAAAPDAAIVLLADMLAPDEEIGLLMAGVAAACPHGVDDAGLARILRAAQRGEVCVRRGLVGRLVRQAAAAGRLVEPSGSPSGAPSPRRGADHAARPAPALAGLTTRELDIARGVGDGLPNKAIGAALGITERTVKAHLTEIFRKLGVCDRLQLALLVSRHAAAESEAADA